MPTGPAVVLTREPEDNQELITALEKNGVSIREIPCLATRYLQPKLPAGPFAAICFTSRRGVRGLINIDHYKKLLSENNQAIIGAVGKATASELLKAGIETKLVANPAMGKILAQLLTSMLPKKSKLAVVRGNLVTGELDRIISQAGHTIIDITVYENLEPKIPNHEPFEVAAVFVTSPSAARRLLGKNPWLKTKRFFCIGSTTACALTSLGIESPRELGIDFDNWVSALTRAYQMAAKPEEQ